MTEQKLNLIFKNLKFFEHHDEAKHHVENLKEGIDIFKKEWSNRMTEHNTKIHIFTYFSNPLYAIMISKEYQYIDIFSMYNNYNSHTNLESLLQIPKINITNEQINKLKEHKIKCIEAFNYIKTNLKYTDVNWNSPKSIIENFMKI